MDSLLINELSGEEFACASGNMHACGHDIHTAMLLTAARMLKEDEDHLQGTVKLMFQNAEEVFKGANDMIEHGILDHSWKRNTWSLSSSRNRSYKYRCTYSSRSTRTYCKRSKSSRYMHTYNR